MIPIGERAGESPPRPDTGVVVVNSNHPIRSNTMNTNETARPRFLPGQIVATPGAIEALRSSGQDAHAFPARHLRGDWGDLDDEDRRLNDEALTDGSRLLSAYVTSRAERLWIITEAAGDDGRRYSTTILLPDEY